MVGEYNGDTNGTLALFESEITAKITFVTNPYIGISCRKKKGSA